MKSIFICLFVGLSASLFGQSNLYYSNYDWKTVPDKYELTEEEKTEDEVILFEKRCEEFANIDENFTQVSLLHVIRMLNTDAAIEENNKMYVSYDGKDVIVQKARVIKPDQSIVTLKSSDIREFKNEDGEVEYRYFALEGLETGCVIEYLHYLKQNPSMSGKSITFQEDVPKRKLNVEIVSPTYLDFQVFPINGVPAFTLDTIDTTVRRKYLNLVDVKAFKNEFQSPDLALAQKVYYKLNKNFNTGKSNLYNYTNAGKIVYDNNFGTPSKKALKSYKAYIADVNKNGGSTLESKLRYLEFKLKSEINVIEASLPQLTDPEFIFENKLASDDGLTKIFLQILREMGVGFELVLTTDRDENAFSTEFEGFNFLDHYLLYITELDSYFEGSIFSRIGFPPYQYTFTKGLFISEKNLGDMKVPISKIKEIKLVDSKKSIDEINATADFSTSIDEPKIVIERRLSGYKAQYPQFILNFMDDEQKEKAKKGVLQYIDENANIEDITYENDNSNAAGVLPFAAKGTFVSHFFLEKAGDKTLFKIGALIGPQAELYNKEKRTMPVQAEFNREYKRSIKVTIPSNISIDNINALNINVVTADGSAGFISEYKLEGEVLSITIREFYNKVYFSVAEYDGYEKVMNAAADFNKIVLVLAKK